MSYHSDFSPVVVGIETLELSLMARCVCTGWAILNYTGVRLANLGSEFINRTLKVTVAADMFTNVASGIYPKAVQQATLLANMRSREQAITACVDDVSLVFNFTHYPATNSTKGLERETERVFRK